MHGRESGGFSARKRWQVVEVALGDAPRFLLLCRGITVCPKGPLRAFYPNHFPSENVSLIYDGGPSSFVHQPFAGKMVKPVRLGFTAMGDSTKFFVLVVEKLDEKMYITLAQLSPRRGLPRPSRIPP